MAIQLASLYREFNREHFGGRLPTVPVEWSDVIPKGAMAAAHVHGISPCYKKYCPLDCRWSFIRIHPILKYLELEVEVERSLLHEMTHIEGLVVDRRFATHTPQFYARIKELVAAGAFDGIL
jgi:hypothetical protein